MDRKWWTLIAVCVATFMLLLDITVVNVALPDIQRDLHASLTSLQWVVDAYSLTLAAFLLTAGSLADLFGRRRVFIARLRDLHRRLARSAGSPATATLLNLARAAPGDRRGGDVRDLARADRPGVPGPRARHGVRRLGRDHRRRRRRRPAGRRRAHRGHRLGVDLLRQRADRHRARSSLTLTQARRVARPGPQPHRLARARRPSPLALFLLVFGLIRGNAEGWGSTADRRARWSASAVAARRVRRHRAPPASSPMLDLSLFRKPAFAGVSIVAFAISAVDVRDVPVPDALHPGRARLLAARRPALRFLPLTLLSFFVAPLAGQPDRARPGAAAARRRAGARRRRPAADARRRRGDSSWTTLLPGFIVAGAGIGLVNPAIASTAIGVVSPAAGGWPRASTTPAGRSGIATGVAALGAVFQRRSPRSSPSWLPSAPPGFADAVSSGGAQAALAGGAVRQPSSARNRRQPGVHQRVQRDPAGGRGSRPDRRRDRVRPGALPRLHRRARRPARCSRAGGGGRLGRWLVSPRRRRAFAAAHEGSRPRGP